MSLKREAPSTARYNHHTLSASGLVRRHLAEFLGRCEERAGPLPAFVKTELEGFAGRCHALRNARCGRGQSTPAAAASTAMITTRSQRIRVTATTADIARWRGGPRGRSLRALVAGSGVAPHGVVVPVARMVKRHLGASRSWASSASPVVNRHRAGGVARAGESLMRVVWANESIRKAPQTEHHVTLISAFAEIHGCRRPRTMLAYAKCPSCSSCLFY